MELQIGSIFYVYKACNFERWLTRIIASRMRNMSIWNIHTNDCKRHQTRGVISSFTKLFPRTRLLLFCEARRSLKAIRLEHELIETNL